MKGVSPEGQPILYWLMHILWRVVVILNYVGGLRALWAALFPGQEPG